MRILKLFFFYLFYIKSFGQDFTLTEKFELPNQVEETSGLLYYNNKIYYSSQKNSLSQNSNNQLLLDVYFSYANPIGIGQNIFGKTEYLKKFCYEYSISNNIVAMGGNIDLLSSVSD